MVTKKSLIGSGGKKDSNIVKGVAILCMLFHHLFYQADRYSAYALTGLIGSAERTLTIAKDMKVCVAAFALMTGYGMVMKAKSAERSGDSGGIKGQIDNTVRSYLNLIKDTVFLILIAVPISLLFSLPRQPADIWGQDLPHLLCGALANMTGLAGFLHISWFISAWWYLKIAVIFLVIFPAVYAVMKMRFGQVGLVAAYLAIVLFSPADPQRDNIWRYFPAFFLGMLLAYHQAVGFVSKWMGKNRAYALLAALALAALYALSVFVQHRYVQIICLTQAMQALLIALFAFLFLAPVPRLSSVLAYLGENSKYMWLIHVYLYGQLMMDFLFSLKNIWLIFAVLTAVSLLLAVILKWINGKILRMLFGKESFSR